MVDEAKSMHDPVATHIALLKLDTNSIVLNLRCVCSAVGQHGRLIFVMSDTSGSSTMFRN